ncbi:ribosomal biogenesis factor isoform X2 [Colius striatus]|uniref:ribosomal biogenesis factor isoform X2 n=1 Tax=Colius striatus TaxID=57412 RepID=UPI002B1E3E29|nr:ribosomal biogenesis factor isoform X2 [Colius striatus]
MGLQVKLGHLASSYGQYTTRRKGGRLPGTLVQLRGADGGVAGPVYSLAEINIKNAEKVNTINKAFDEVQKELQQLSKGTAAEPQKSPQVSTDREEEPANMDAATTLLAQL